MSLSYKEKLELTIFGYVRSNHKNEIPDDIIRICLDYYNKIEIIWDVFNTKLTDFISNDGLKINVPFRPEFSTFASSVGWNTGIHCFTIKQVNTPGVHCGIGIVSSEHLPNIASNTGSSYFMSQSTKDTLAFILDERTIWKLECCEFDDIFDTKLNAMDDNDEVTVVIDCNKWMLTFYINDKICNKSIDIDNNLTYHAAICVWEKSIASYQLIETMIDIEKVINPRIMDHDIDSL